MTIDADVLPELAESFRRFASFEAAGISPLYERLAEAVAGDPYLLGLTSVARRDQRRPTLFFAAVHDVVLRLAVEYPASLDELTEFCRTHRDELIRLISTRHTQTNEVNRCGQFLPALALIAARTGTRLGLIELGASAGLNLLLDRFHYRYVGARGQAAIGDEASDVEVLCEVRGEMPPLPNAIPEMGTLLGIDLVPVDVSLEEQARWLRACVWSGATERAERLTAAISLARVHPPEVLAGDAADRLAEAVARVPEDEAVVVFHSSVLPYFSGEDHRRLRAAMRRVAADRDLW